MPSGKNATDEFSNQPFKDLKERLLEMKKKKHLYQIRGGMPQILLKNTKGLSPDKRKEKIISDEELFRDAMKEVEEIREYRAIPVTPKRTFSVCSLMNTSSDKEALKVLKEIVDGKRPVDLSDTQEYVEWINDDYHEDVIKKLHDGQFSVQDCLDLHGIIVEEGRKEVECFFQESLRKGYRCIKIIHGRGRRSAKGPVMKHALINWLLRRHRKHIAAFVTARQCDGGLGALYVLLK